MKLIYLFVIICIIFLAGCNLNDGEVLEIDSYENKFNLENISNLENVEEIKMQIRITDENKNIIIYNLNNSTAAKELYVQLPLITKVENYSNDEKIFYPQKKLNIQNAPLVNAELGTLAYFKPWDDVVMFYNDFGSYSGLYELGNAVSGKEKIKDLSGMIKIEKLK